MNRKIITEKKEESKKVSIADKIRAEIEEEYKQELEEKFTQEQEKFRLMIEQKKESLEAEYIAKREQLEKEIKLQEKLAKKEMNKKISENKKKIEEEREAFEKQREKELMELRKKEKEATEKVKKEKERCSSEIARIKKETNDAIQRKNTEIQRLNEIIQEKNNNEAELQALREKIKSMEEIIKRRETKKEEFITDSIFDISGTGTWYEIGYMVLEKAKEKKSFMFSDDKILSYYTEDQRYPDGIIIEKGKKTRIIAVHEILEKDGMYESLVRFYSDSRVVPIYNLLGVLNFILHIYQIGFNIKDKKQAKGITIKCLVYSEKSLKSALYKEDSIGTYLLTYKDNKYTNIGVLAQTLYKYMHCSKKGVSNDIIDRTENVALQKSMQIEGKGEYIENIQYLSENDDGESR